MLASMARSNDSGIAAAASSKKGTALILVCNCIGVLCVLYAFFSPLFLYSSALRQPLPGHYKDRGSGWWMVSSCHNGEDNSFNKTEAARIQIHVREALEARKANEPLELIKRVREIQSEVYVPPPKDGTFLEANKKSASQHLAGRLKRIRKPTAKKNLQALEEWRKKKLESSNEKEEMIVRTEREGPKVLGIPSHRIWKLKDGTETLKAA